MQTRHNTNRRTTRPSQDTGRTARTLEEEVVDWLRDAYAMERGLEESLAKQTANEKLSTEMRDRASRHLDETKRHAEDVQAALRSLGSDVSTIKTGVGRAVQGAKGLFSAIASDEEIKDHLDAYSMEHFEIACYTALALAAQRAAMPQIAQLCQRIISDEERYAQSLRHSLPEIVDAYLTSATTETPST